MKITAFCVSRSSGQHPTYITSFEVPAESTTAEIASAAVRECAEEWDDDEDDIACIGIAEGDVKIIDWCDLCEGGIPTD